MWTLITIFILGLLFYHGCYNKTPNQIVERPKVIEQKVIEQKPGGFIIIIEEEPNER